MTVALRFAAVAGAALSAIACWQLLLRTPIGSSATWLRTNYRGRIVSLLGGPVFVGTALAGALVVSVAGSGASSRSAIALVVVLAAAGMAGTYDDLRGDAGSRGLAGHLRSARRGRLTSGLVKIVVLAACGLAAGVILERGLSLWAVADGVLVAATANLINLFDLRPGRAGKVAVAAFALVLGVGSAALAAVAWCAGAALGTLPGDVRERLMLGDGGANAMGAALGVGFVVALSRPARVCVLAVVVVLTLVSEKVSFSRVIDRTPPLRWLDELWRADVRQRAAA